MHTAVQHDTRQSDHASCRNTAANFLAELRLDARWTRRARHNDPSVCQMVKILLAESKGHLLRFTPTLHEIASHARTQPL